MSYSCNVSIIHALVDPPPPHPSCAALRFSALWRDSFAFSASLVCVPCAVFHVPCAQLFDRVAMGDQLMMLRWKTLEPPPADFSLSHSGVSSMHLLSSKVHPSAILFMLMLLLMGTSS